MRADMALAEVGVLHITELVVAVFCARHRGEAAEDRLAEAAPEERYAVHEGVGHGGNDAGLDLRGGGLGNGGGNAVGRAGLIIRTEGRGLDDGLAVGLRGGGRRL
jgi:hypothetical protein